MSPNITSKKWENGELVESGERVTVDGRLPGGDGGFWLDDDGTLKPVNGKPLSVENVNTDHWVPAGSTASEINAIIADANDGDTIRFESGDYTGLTDEITDQGKNDITLAGPGGRGAHLKLASDAQKNVIFLKGVSGWEIKGLYVDGNGANQTDGGSNKSQCGIYMEDCDDTWVHHNVVYDTIYANIRARAIDADSRNIFITDNITDTTRGGSDVAEDNISLTASTGSVTIENWLILGNECLNCGHQAIEISGDANKGIIANNYVWNAAEEGMFVHGGNDVVVEGNYIEQSGGTGLSCNNYRTTIEGNIILSSAGNGILCQDDQNRIEYLNVNGNIVWDTGNIGIWVNDTSSDHCKVADNIVVQTPNIGILSDGTGSSITDNLVVGTLQGVVLQGDQSKASGNYVEGCDEHGVRQNAQHCQIEDNYLYNNAADSIIIQGSDSQIDGNYSYQAGRYGINIQSVSGVEISDTKIEASSTAAVNDGGTATKWDGVIGGGRLGGTDLGSVTGSFAGEKALADGTTGTAYLEAVWDGSQWVQSDGTAV